MLPDKTNQSLQDNDNSVALEFQILQLKKELEKVAAATYSLDTRIRTQLANEIVELQELMVIDKMLRKAKKEKRLEQKKKGKNYKEPVGIKASTQKKVVVSTESSDDQKLRKKLYKEAMVNVHPDKFAGEDGDEDLATELTVELIEVYNNGSLDRLKALHAQIMSGNAIPSVKVERQIDVQVQTEFLEQQIKDLEAQLEKAKQHPTYQALLTYASEEAYLAEVKLYIEDRLVKLRKRTRKYKA